MADCKNLVNCSFMKAYENSEEHKLSLKGFVSLYCKGEKTEDCKRLQICNTIGKERVPVNMMPNGFPLPGTSKDGWDPEALKMI